MTVRIPNSIIKQLKKKCKSNPLIKDMEEGWSASLDTRFLSEKEFNILYDLVKKDKDLDKDIRKLLTKLNHVRTAAKAKTKPLKSLQPLTEALIEYISKLPNKVVYLSGEGSALFPYYVDEIKMVPYDHQSGTPAHIMIQLIYVSRGKRKGKRLHVGLSDIGKAGTTIENLATNILELIPESKEANEEHAKQVATYKEFRIAMGKQFLGYDKVKRIEENYWSSNAFLQLPAGGGKLIMEDDVDMGQDGSMATNDFWCGSHVEEEEHVVLPTHPVMRLFDLSSHQFVTAHVAQIEPYQYDTAIFKKLILDPSKKNMIDILVNAEHEKGCDIIKGKSGGIIIMSSGEPGTGKTLTAEVYAETAEKALYVVQCSQLGISADELEERLKVVLDRATKWGVVLLIDEADVYVHERGSNLEQNAIVGVFLRLLEYYNGILFLTTNRELVVDDAIISRITAHVRYTLPSAEDSLKIWGVLAAQYKLQLQPRTIENLVENFPSISGRTIKQLIRLVKVMSMGKQPRHKELLEMFSEAAIYQPLTTTKRSRRTN